MLEFRLLKLAGRLREKALDIRLELEFSEILDQCGRLLQTARSRSEVSGHLAGRLAAEELRCQRVRWRLRETTFELEQEVLYRRAVLDAFGGIAAPAGESLLRDLGEAGDRLLEFYA